LEGDKNKTMATRSPFENNLLLFMTTRKSFAFTIVQISA